MSKSPPAGRVPAVSLLFGKKGSQDQFDDFLAGRHIARIKASLGGDDKLSVSEYDAAEALVADWLDEIQTPALWGGVRLVVVRSAQALLMPPADQRARFEPALAVLASIAASKSPVAHLIMIAAALDVKGAAPRSGFPAAETLIRAVNKSGGLCPCIPPYESGAKSALIEHASELGVRLAPAAAQLLIHMVGAEQMALHEELDKLIAASGDAKRIDTALVEAVAAERSQATVFSLSDNILALDVAASLSDLRALREVSRTRSSGYILSSLDRSFRRCLAAAEMVRSGQSPQAAAASLGVPAFFQADFLSRLRAWKPDALLALLDRMLLCDVHIKTGALPEDVALETFVADACARRLQSLEPVGRWLYEI